ncbi:twin-arginine protein translocation system subunit TatC [Betaproteobacteria bacterium SCGC AG-212-J23]|nr:twin-arginine protein translocation system subunit TatC [Betaproteobacteria bacterium SCGC AG-212-J23]
MSVNQESFISHLIELRTRLLRALASIFVVMLALVIWPGLDAVYNFVAAPLGFKGAIATDIVGPITVPLKVLALVSLMVALPYVLYQLWAFVAPGLYEHEKKFALPLVIASTGLFYAGVAFCYYFVLRQVFVFIASFAPSSITPMPDADKYLTFVLTMFLAFGVTFEIPIAVILLVRFGLVTIEQLVEWRSYVVLGNAVVAAVITPPDVVSMLALLIPMCLLYEVGLFVARYVGKRERPADLSEKQT